MKRLTINHPDGTIQATGTLDEIAFRLAAYEDTGLEPEEVRSVKWVPVTERLPNNFSHVLGFMAWGGMSVLLCENERFFSQGSFTPMPKNAVTQWMPLPEPPEGGADG